MIPFFRKIRKKMADDNKPIKYLRYAIGEIALVMIGILLALQVNNWNENRKNNQITRTYYDQLLNDFENDEIFLKEAISNVDSTFIRYQTYKEIFEKPDISLWGATRNIGKVFGAESQRGWNFE